MITMTALAICPPWCVIRHDIADVEQDGWIEHASEPIGLIEIDAMQMVLSDGTFGPIEEPHLYYAVTEANGSPEDARRFAAALLRAADRLEEIRSAAR